MKKIFFVILALITYNFGFSQNSDVEFKFVKVNSENKIQTKTIIFTILGVKNVQQSNSIATKFREIEGVTSFKIFYNRRCELITINDSKLNADFFRKILLQENVDYDIYYVTVNNKLTHATLMEWKDSYPVIGYSPKPVPGDKWVYPSDFPVLTSTKNKSDEARLLKEKQLWIETHPEEYKNMTGIEYLDYSLKLNK